MSSSEKFSGGCLDCSSQALDWVHDLEEQGSCRDQSELLFKKLVDEIPRKAALRDRGADQSFQDTVLSSPYT